MHECQHGKALAAAIEPLLDEILELEKKIESVQTTPGEKGEPGKDGESVTPDEVAAVLAEKYIDKLRGEPGETQLIDYDRLTKEVIDRYAEDLRGTDGKDGVSPDLDEVVEQLV